MFENYYILNSEFQTRRAYLKRFFEPSKSTLNWNLRMFFKLSNFEIELEN